MATFPPETTARQRVVFGRIQSLITKTSERGERLAPLRKRAGHRARRADGGAAEGVGALSGGSTSGSAPGRWLVAALGLLLPRRARE
jgi:hypothetical protein